MDAMETLDRFFEGEFQKFMREGHYTHTKDEDWERTAAQAPIRKLSEKCPHGKSRLTCNTCYFGT